MVKQTLIFIPLLIILIVSKSYATTWTNLNQDNSGLWGNGARVAAFDQNNILWLGYAEHGYGLQRYDGSTWTVYTYANSGLPDMNNNVYSIMCEGNNVWVGTPSGLALLNNNQWAIFNTSNSGIKSNAIYFVKKDKQDNYWISHGPAGFSLMTNGTITAFPDTAICPYFRYGISDAVFDDSSGWFSTSIGLVHFKLTDSTWVHYDVSNSNLMQNTISCLARDKTGDIWLGYGGFGVRGLAKFDGFSFQNYNPFSNVNTWISHLDVDSANNILIGSRAEGLYKFDGGNFNHFVNPPPDSSATNFLFIDQHNRIWYGEPITGIWISDWNNELSSISFEDIDFVVFPNVTDGLTTIAFNMIKEDATIKIIDIVGNNMKIEILPKRSTKMEINISELASGLYIISIEINNSTYTRKVIRR